MSALEDVERLTALLRALEKAKPRDVRLAVYRDFSNGENSLTTLERYLCAAVSDCFDVIRRQVRAALIDQREALLEKAKVEAMERLERLEGRL